MRNRLSLKWVISGSFLFLIAVVLLIYSQLLPVYTVRGLLYTASAMMEEEAQYFVRHYKKDPTTPPPRNYFFEAVIGKEALPASVRQLLEAPPSMSFGAVQVFGRPDGAVLVGVTRRDAALRGLRRGRGLAQLGVLVAVGVRLLVDAGDREACTRAADEQARDEHRHDGET